MTKFKHGLRRAFLALGVAGTLATGMSVPVVAQAASGGVEALGHSLANTVATVDMTVDNLTVNQSATVNGSTRLKSDNSHDVLTVTTGDIGHGILVEDKNHAPIFVVPAYGGPAVLGDNFRMFYHGQVWDASMTAWQDGSITIGQSVGDPYDTNDKVRNQGGPTIYGGDKDPNKVPPAHAGHSFHVGDRYFWSGSDGAFFGFPVLAWNGLYWQNTSSS